MIRVLFIVISILFLQCHRAEKKEAKPNVIFIMADDLGYGDLSCYGQTRFQTPNIDALAREGLVFTQHYSGSAVCAPSRSALMTGLHTGHTFIRGNMEVQPEGQYPLPDSAFTIAELFKGQAYATGMFGKWGLGNMEAEGSPLKQGFDRFTGFVCQRLAHNYYPTHLWRDTLRIALTENEGSSNGSYAPDLIHRDALNFIDENKNKPFFLYLPVTTPHAELAAPEDYLKKYHGVFGKEIPFKGAEPGSDHYKEGPYASQDEPRAAFAAMVSLMDDQVGGIIHKLKDLGIYENTLIIFSSDNGPHLEGGADPDYFNSNGPLRGYKRDLYEGGIRIPLIVHWAGTIAPGKTDHVSAFWDFLPTFCELLGTAMPPHSDGLSIYPTFRGKTGEQKNHDYLYWEFHEQGGKQAIRKGDWKLVKLNVNDSAKSYFELYNLADDLSESANLASSHQEIVNELDNLMKQARVMNPVFKFDWEN
ncbi:MAG TPA: arylsulfatase [Cyclobacteriaceae bacterium]|nr:arylsulfatase [Cyclobacteriaceae bacterium]